MIYWQYEEKDIKEEIENRIKRSEALLTAWGNVEVSRKKNGEEFATIGKAIKGARIKAATLQGNELYISARYDLFGGIVSNIAEDTINLYVYLDELPKEDERRAGRSLVNGVLRAIAPKTPDEVRKEIEFRRAQLADNINNYKRDIDDLPRLFAAYRGMVNRATKELEKEATRGLLHKTLFYLITKTK